MKHHSTTRWIALFALALLALVPATQPATAGAPPITVPFDHLTTGFELDGVHRDLPCEQCHLNAVFKGTPRDCGTCHITGSQYNATPKTATHIASTNNCALCHNTISFRPYVHFEHSEVLGACVTCHNGTIAQGEGPTHPATSTDCAACHTVISWNPPKAVDHTQIPLAVSGFCIICHNGTQASGKPANHVVTNLECGDCHLTTTWVGATFDHTGITSGCVSCHNGTKAVGKQAGHMPTTNLCENCHTTGIGTATPSWVPSAFDHTQMTVQTCQTCHSGTVKISTGFVSGQPTNHVPLLSSQGDCATCHGNNPAAETWTVLAASIPTLHAGLPTNNCLMCHAGQTFAGVPAPYIPMSISGVSPTKSTPLAPPHIPILAGTDCSACHGQAYQAGGFGPATAMSAKTHTAVSTTCNTCHDTGKSFYVGSGTPLQLRPADHVNSTDPRMATGDCSLCHETTDWNSTAMPAGHMPNPSNLSCVQCHASAPSDYTPATLAALSALHTGITGNCGQCHGNNVAALTWFNNYTPKDAILTPAHIPYLTGTDCSSCHATNYVTGGFGPTNMSAAKHAFVPTSCDTCHEAGLSFYLGASTPPLQGRPADHIAAGGQQATGDCSGCHTTTDWTSNTFPPGHMPNPGNQACSVCHTAIGSTVATYATLASVAVLHTGITGNCGQCHGNNVAALTWYNNYTPKDAILSPAHIPYLTGTDCSSCHAANYATGGFGPTNMSAAKHAFVPTSCDSCHEAGLSFYLGASTPPLQGRPADHVANGGQQATGDCSGCHNTTDWTSNSLPPGHMPNPSGQACSVCHTAIGSTLASYATLASVAVLHTGITGNCGQCHGNNVAALTWYNNYTPKDAILSPAHIPYLTGTDCSSCHAANYATGGFGPTNMSSAKHAFVPTSCDSCHEAGLSFYLGASTPPLQGRPADHVANGGQQATGDCSGCHNTTDWSSNSFPAGHMPNPGNQACSVCHTAIGSTLASYATLASVAVLHTGITSGCQACHGGPGGALTFYNNNDNPKAAAGLSPAHIPYSNGVDCVSCHAVNYVTGGFGPATAMSAAKHAFVPTTCDTCHEAGLSFYPGAALNLQGRPATHVSAPNPASQATGDCSLCHNTTTWTTPTTLPNGHMPIPGTQTCSVCHTGTLTANPTSYAQLASIAVLHTGIASGCAQCHGGATALTFYNNNDNPLAAASLSPPHIPAFTGEDCSACHAANYATGGFGPMNMTQATHAGVGNTCNSCHEAGLNFYMGAASPKLQGRPTDHTGTMAAPADCSGCHTTAGWGSNTLPAGHMPNPGNQVCNTCHTAAPTNYATMASIAVLHTGIAGGCAQCHGVTQLTFYNNNDNPKSAVLAPAHIPILSGADCGACHAANYAAGGFGPMNMTQATHASVTTTCTTCHEAGRSFYMGAANPGLQGRPADHTQGQMVAPNDCSLCHTTANWNSNTLPAGHMPNPGNQACAVCHTAAPTNYATMASIAVLHTGIAGGCAQCHGVTQLTFYNNNDNPKSAVLAPAHIPILSGADCGACHAANYAAGGFGPMNMTQATHASVTTTCTTCHEAGLSFYMGAANPGLQGRPADHTQGQMVAPNDCSLCHTTANWNSNALPAGHMPNPGNQACTVCHTAAPTNYATMASVAVLHTGITNACATCHGVTQLTFYNNNDNPKSAVLAPAHIPILSGADCGSCHAAKFVTGGFGPMNMTQATHASVTTTCITCHERGLSFYMGAANPALQGRPADHTSGQMVAPNDCSLCHTTANWNSNTLPAGHMPNPGNQGCTVCHTGAPSNYATLAANAVLHTGITSGCITCHGAPNATAPVFYLNFTPKPASGLSPVHIPTATTGCENCHTNTIFTTFSGTTMSSAKHTAMFAVIGKSCDGCHDASTLKFYGVTNLTTRPNGHHVGQDCSGCHNTNNWSGGAASNKKTAAAQTTRSTVTAVVAAPTNATGKSAIAAMVNAARNGTGATNASGLSAIAATANVASSGTGTTTASSTSAIAATATATNTTQSRGARTGTVPSFSGPATAPGTRMSHFGVTATCVSCHNGVLAPGKGPTHVASNDACQNCHTTLAWLPARFDHRGVSASCISCHNGVLAPGKPAKHVQTAQDCGTCHNTLNWQNVVFSHVGINGTCQSCHNGVTATGKQPQHVVTTQDCSSCHNTQNWTTVTAPPNGLRPLIRSRSPAKNGSHP